MKIRGYAKLTAIFVVDFLSAYAFAGLTASVIIMSLITVYVLFGEYVDLWRDRAVRIDHLDSATCSRLYSIQQSIGEDVRNATGSDIKNMQLYVVPSSVPNAFTYGFRSVAFSRFLLDNCDDATLCAILGHEVSHMLYLDAVFNRALFATVTVLVLTLMIASFISTSFLWLIFIVLCLLNLCGGIVSILLFRGAGKVVKGFYTFMQYCLLFLYRTILGVISRQSEYRADQFSCILGYGPQLQYFLNRFEDLHQEPAHLHEILYATHPPTYSRIQRIEQQKSTSPNGFKGL